MVQVRTSLRAFVVATVAALLVRLFVFENYYIRSASMTPGLLNGDFVTVYKASFNLRLPFTSYEIFKIRTPRQSEVVLFSVPEHGNETFLKRVVAVGGDKVEIKEGMLLINDKPASYRSLDEPQPELARQIAGVVQDGGMIETPLSGKSYGIHMGKARAENYGPISVPSGQLFVLSDNREEKSDSRTWGPVSFSELRGRALFIWFSKEPHGKIRGARIGTWVD